MSTHPLIDSRSAWISTVGVSLANGIAFGTAYTFGTFFDAMGDEFGSSRGSTALIFGITLLLFFGFGSISGPISDRVGPHVVLAIGGIMFVGGLLLTAQVTSVVLGYVTYGLGVGLGSGWFTAPLTGAAGAMFVRHRPAALGLVAVGNGLGTLILVPLADALITAHGWRTAYRWLALVGAVGFAIAFVLIRRPPPRPAPPITVDEPTRLSADPRFRAMFVTATLTSVGLFVAFAFIVPFATDNGIERESAARIMALIGLSSIVGRLALTNLVNRIGAVRLFQRVLWAQPIVYGLWLVAGDRLWLLTIFAIGLGVAYGGFVAISPEVALTLFGGTNVGTLIGRLFLSFGIGGFIGPPLAGWLGSEFNNQSLVIGGVIAVVAAAGVVVIQLTPREGDTSEDTRT